MLNNKNTSMSEVTMVIIISMGVVVDMLPAAWVSVTPYTCCIFQTSYHIQCTHVHLSCMCTFKVCRFEQLFYTHYNLKQTDSQLLLLLVSLIITHDYEVKLLSLPPSPSLSPCY